MCLLLGCFESDIGLSRVRRVHFIASCCVRSGFEPFAGAVLEAYMIVLLARMAYFGCRSVFKHWIGPLGHIQKVPFCTSVQQPVGRTNAATAACGED